MARPKRELKPTDAELAILRVLWKRGASTVREVHDELGGDASGVYTTVLKLLQIMTEKGLVTREEQGRAHLYTAAFGEAQTQRTLLTDLIQRAFAGSAQALVLRALETEPTSSEQLAEIRKVLDRLEGGDR